MILLCGIPSESPLALVGDALDRLGEPYRWFNQRRFGETSMRFDVDDDGISGWLEIGGEGLPLGAIDGVYTRLMDHARLPELDGRAAGSAETKRAAAVDDTLMQWAEITDARVVNRIAAMGSNMSKPYQAQLIRRYGFEVPLTLITTDATEVRAFRAEHGRIIYKSISGVRSIVQTFDDGDLDRLPSIRWCPTQFQKFVEGVDVRVHVVGERVFATEARSDATDYRYAKRQTGRAARLSAIELGDELAERCVALTEGLGLAFSGIDLKLTPDGRVFCFEVNPCPGYSYFELNSGQAISTAVAQYLAGR